MKKNSSYRDKLIELANIYNVKEVKDYIRNRKNLTSGQLELILRKNKIVIPKDFNTNFFKENFSKPILKLKSNVTNLKDETIKDKNKLIRKIQNFKHDSVRKLNNGIYYLWKGAGKIG